MKTKIFITAVLFLLCAAVFPLAAQQSNTIGPPSWMQGSWTYTETLPDEMGGGEAEFSVRFNANDILFDAEESLGELIRSGEVAVFTQNAGSSSYEIYIEYSDGYWWRETFQRPAAGASTMRSTYETSDGENDECIYTRQQ